jgi:Fic family protein
MIEHPPKISQKEIMKAIKLLQQDEIVALVEKINLKYAYWSKVKYQKLPTSVTHEELWACVKLSRMLKEFSVQNDFEVCKMMNMSASMTNEMQRLCHTLDMNFGGSWGDHNLIPEGSQEQYLISSLMEEAITSSQMEGAATTRKVAKEMLRKERSPRNRSDQMILNNYRTIHFVVEHKEDDLTPELLLHIHQLMTKNTLDNKEDAGRFRMDDKVVVENSMTHEVVHTPPSVEKIPRFIDELCVFFNTKHQKGGFIHPIIKGIMVHYLIAFMHPFVDGNGRTARALFYWYLLKQGYWLTQYLSISRMIGKSKDAYEKAYLYAAADDYDMGYFIAYHLKVLNTAFESFQAYIRRKAKEEKKQKEIILSLKQKGTLNERQAELIHLISKDAQYMFTIKEIQNRFSVSHTTAKSDVVGLVEAGFLVEIALNKVKKAYIKGPKFDTLL